ncbi:MAG: hypothetical protein JWR76_597 [Mucilaginibacter sp.]|nr:hypothetical protein [Mucilaginibacter sp.]
MSGVRITTNSFTVRLIHVIYNAKIIGIKTSLNNIHLLSLGVRFITSPTVAGSVKNAVLDDTCGNLIQIYQL